MDLALVIYCRKDGLGVFVLSASLNEPLASAANLDLCINNLWRHAYLTETHFWKECLNSLICAIDSPRRWGVSIQSSDSE